MLTSLSNIKPSHMQRIFHMSFRLSFIHLGLNFMSCAEFMALFNAKDEWNHRVFTLVQKAQGWPILFHFSLFTQRTHIRKWVYGSGCQMNKPGRFAIQWWPKAMVCRSSPGPSAISLLDPRQYIWPVCNYIFWIKTWVYSLCLRCHFKW